MKGNEERFRVVMIFNSYLGAGMKSEKLEWIGLCSAFTHKLSQAWTSVSFTPPLNSSCAPEF